MQLNQEDLGEECVNKESVLEDKTTFNIVNGCEFLYKLQPFANS